MGLTPLFLPPSPAEPTPLPTWEGAKEACVWWSLGGTCWCSSMLPSVHPKSQFRQEITWLFLQMVLSLSAFLVLCAQGVSAQPWQQWVGLLGNECSQGTEKRAGRGEALCVTEAPGGGFAPPDWSLDLWEP